MGVATEEKGWLKILNSIQQLGIVRGEIINKHPFLYNYLNELAPAASPGSLAAFVGTRSPSVFDVASAVDVMIILIGGSADLEGTTFSVGNPVLEDGGVSVLVTLEEK